MLNLQYTKTGLILSNATTESTLSNSLSVYYDLYG